MDQKQRGVSNKKPLLRGFVKGFLAAIFIFAIFTTGVLFGNGTVKVNFIGVKPIEENRSLPKSLDYSSVDEVYQALVRKYDGALDEQKLLDGLKKGLVDAAGDPYTTYFNPTEAEEFKEALNGTFSGIGAELGKDGNDIIIISPIAGFPAEKAGLKSKDVILSINGEDANGISIDEAVRRIRGEAGTTVTLNVLREGQEPREIKIVREVITLASVETEILDGNIGYLKLTRFSDDTEGLVDAAIKDFKAKNVKGVILDLRGNPGGYLDTAVSLSENWLKPGQVILEEKRDGRVIQQFAAKAEGPLNGVKTVVLIDGGSASASEITAGALKDNKVATLVGAKTFGKGSVQEPLTLGTGGILKVTVARWFTPGGQNIDKEGIKPDIEVKLDEEKLKKEIDTQLEAAKKQLLQ